MESREGSLSCHITNDHSQRSKLSVTTDHSVVLEAQTLELKAELDQDQSHNHCKRGVHSWAECSNKTNPKDLLF